MKALTFLARRFVAGETSSIALKAVKNLNEKSVLTTVDILGENVGTEQDAHDAAQDYIDLLDEIQSTGVNSNVSLKLTQMGLDISTEFCLNNVKRIVEHAERLGNFVRIDMESSEYTDRTLDIFFKLYEQHKNVGIVIQAYLRRTDADVDRLIEVGAPVRLCKGAYKESPEVALQSMQEIRENFKRLARKLVEGGCHLALATHDEKLIRWGEQWIHADNLQPQQIEFQMLYGLRRTRLGGLAQKHQARSYVPYGSQWLPYFTRRLQERKENIFFVLKSLIHD
jgi:proline dehydrogenase